MRMMEEFSIALYSHRFRDEKTSLFDFQDKCVWVCVAVKRETVAATVAAAEEKLKSILFLQPVSIASYEKYRIYNKFVFRVIWWFVSTCSFVQLARAYNFIIQKSIIYTKCENKNETKSTRRE